MVQAVEYLHSKCKALSSKSNTVKERERERERGRERERERERERKHMRFVVCCLFSSGPMLEYGPFFPKEPEN
jgi:hypothetical protein